MGLKAGFQIISTRRNFKITRLDGNSSRSSFDRRTWAVGPISPKTKPLDPRFFPLFHSQSPGFFFSPTRSQTHAQPRTRREEREKTRKTRTKRKQELGIREYSTGYGDLIITMIDFVHFVLSFLFFRIPIFLVLPRRIPVECTLE